MRWHSAGAPAARIRWLDPKIVGECSQSGSCSRHGSFLKESYCFGCAGSQRLRAWQDVEARPLKCGFKKAAMQRWREICAANDSVVPLIARGEMVTLWRADRKSASMPRPLA
jgi:hypothetical protein